MNLIIIHNVATTKQSANKQSAYFMGNTLYVSHIMNIECMSLAILWQPLATCCMDNNGVMCPTMAPHQLLDLPVTEWCSVCISPYSLGRVSKTLQKISSEVVKMTTSGATNDDNLFKLTFQFQYCYVLSLFFHVAAITGKRVSNY